MSVIILTGDCRTLLATLPEKSVQCVVTSPPYLGLRNYQHSDQIGQEPDVNAYVAAMVEVFGHVRRVLRDDGTVWLNLGDTMRNKQLLMVPSRVALALQADGWVVRSEIVWHKPCPLPESVTDRPTSAHERVFLLSKARKYFYDINAVRQPLGPRSLARLKKPEFVSKGRRGEDRGKWDSGLRSGANLGDAINPEGSNLRNVWTVRQSHFKGAHFATMPEDVVSLCLRAGSRPGDMVLDPFGGAGTTGLVASRLGRDATLIELNPDYAAMARERIDADAPLLAGPAQPVVAA